MGSCRCLCRTSTIVQQQQRGSSSSSITYLTSGRNGAYYYSLPLPLLRLLLLGLMLTTFCWTSSVSAFSLQQKGGASGDGCLVDGCFEHYKNLKGNLDFNGDHGGDGSSPSGSGSSSSSSTAGSKGSTDEESHCIALRTYMSCLKRVHNSSRACQSNINFHSVRNVVKNWMKQQRCANHGPTMDAALLHTPEPPPSHVPERCLLRSGDPTVQHCGLFGDPHLRTFNNQFQTCKVRGAWPLVNNEFLTVQVTNDPVLVGNGEATATSKLTVMVKSHPCGSEHFHTYQAMTDYLPPAFEDGSTQFGPHGLVRVVEVEPNKHVEIHIKYINTTIVVRQIGRYFTFAIQMPKQIVDKSGSGAPAHNGAHKGRHSHSEPELCVKGCPPSERIDYKHYLAMRRDQVNRIQNEAGDEDGEGQGKEDPEKGEQIFVSRQQAEEMCRESGLVDFYFDSCVFDLMATGDRNFTQAALVALQDLRRLHPDVGLLSNRTSLKPYDDIFFSAAAAGSRTVTWWAGVLCALCALLTLHQQQLWGGLELMGARVLR